MDDHTKRLIRDLNRITADHFTSGGSFIGNCTPHESHLIMAAWYASNSLDDGEPLKKRVMNAIRAREEIVVYGVRYKDNEHRRDAYHVVLNANSYALSLICEAIP